MDPPLPPSPGPQGLYLQVFIKYLTLQAAAVQWAANPDTASAEWRLYSTGRGRHSSNNYLRICKVNCGKCSKREARDPAMTLL